MKQLLPLLVAATISGCVATSNSPSTGFDAYLAGERGSYTPISTAVSKPTSAVYDPKRILGKPAQANASNPAEFRRASESAFGIGSHLSGETVVVNGKDMQMRLVNSRGLTFAVLKRSGVNWGRTTDKELVPQLTSVVRNQSRCMPSGKYAMKRFTNSAHTQYAIHVDC